MKNMFIIPFLLISMSFGHPNRIVLYNGDCPEGTTPLNIAEGRFVRIAGSEKNLMPGSIGGNNEIDLQSHHLPSLGLQVRSLNLQEGGVSSNKWPFYMHDIRGEEQLHKFKREKQPINIEPEYFTFNACIEPIINNTEKIGALETKVISLTKENEYISQELLALKNDASINLTNVKAHIDHTLGGSGKNPQDDHIIYINKSITKWEEKFYSLIICIVVLLIGFVGLFLFVCYNLYHKRKMD